MPGRPLPIVPSPHESSSNPPSHSSSPSSVSSTTDSAIHAHSSNLNSASSSAPDSNIIPSRFQPTLDRFDYITRNAEEIQRNLLRSIIEANASCVYLQQFEGIGALSAAAGMEAAGSAASGGERMSDSKYCEEFKKVVPLVSHPEIVPFIERIVEHGNEGLGRGLLTAAPVQGLCLSSGTTNTKAKHLLYHDGLKQGTLEVASIAAAFRERIFPVEAGSRILEFLFCGKLTTTPGGLSAGTASTLMIRSDAFRMRQKRTGVLPCSPEEVVLSPDCRQSMYCHLLCGLFHADDVQVFSAPFAFTLVEALRTFETEWHHLCDDIRSGKLNPKITDPTLRAVMAEHVLSKPNPELARSIASKCRGLTSKRALESGGAWKGVVGVLWPRCKYVLSILTGAMEVYVEKLEFYTGGAIPLVSADYAATEGWIGVNIGPTSAPKNVSFTILPTLAFFEFIPLNRRSNASNVNETSDIGGGVNAALAAYDEGKPVGLTEVKVGQEYEIVMTTEWGLYRYRLGDIVRVTGFYNNAPQVAYVCRKNVMLSLNIDKITEKDLKAVVDEAAKRLTEASGSTMELVDYTSYADRTTTPGHYVLFWEVQGGLELVGKSEAGQKPAKALKKAAEGGEGRGAQGESSMMHGQAPVISTVEQRGAGSSSNVMNARGGAASRQRQTTSASEVLADCAALMDRSFVEAGYVTSRKMGTIGALELCVVQRGTFSRLVDRFMMSGAAITQYKTPRCLGSTDALSLMRSSAVASLFSPSSRA